MNAVPRPGTARRLGLRAPTDRRIARLADLLSYRNFIGYAMTEEDRERYLEFLGYTPAEIAAVREALS